jgi:Arc/MetJ-type ribon-helix-helix transcriptional regulator
MKTITVRLPEKIAADIEMESRRRKVSKSDVVRERLLQTSEISARSASLEAIADLIGSIDDLPSDLSARKKTYLRTTSYGRKHAR